tara:strand:+ start:93 stop:812 length:720 start_codon:yes stop_codon:yes gene_type:complete
MALPTSNISINDIHTTIGGGSSTEASLNDADVRSWGNTYGKALYNFGAAGVPTGSGTEIALGEFRDANPSPATTAFAGTFTHKYQVNPGGQYTPSSYGDYSNNFSNPNFVGTFAGITGTHSIAAFSNSGLSSTAGSINLQITTTNTSGTTPTNSGWTSVTFKSYNNTTYTLQRSAATFTGNAHSLGTSASWSWGTVSLVNGAYNYTYSFTDYFGGKNNRTIVNNLITYFNHTDIFRINI